MTRDELNGPGGRLTVEVSPAKEGYRVVVDGVEHFVKVKQGAAPGSVVAEISGKPMTVSLVQAGGDRVDIVLGDESLSFQRLTPAVGLSSPPVPEQAPKGIIPAPMPGKVIGTMAKRGDRVKRGDPLVILESMKMEVAVRADRDGEVAEILVADGTAVKRGQPLVRLG